MTVTCGRCGAQLSVNEFCPHCTEEMSNRPDPATMTPEARVAEMGAFIGSHLVPWDIIHGRIEALVGRPVWTHEIGHNWNGLVEQARRREPMSYTDAANAAMALIPPEKSAVVKVSK